MARSSGVKHYSEEQGTSKKQQTKREYSLKNKLRRVFHSNVIEPFRIPQGIFMWTVLKRTHFYCRPI